MNSSTPPELFRVVVRTGRPAISTMQPPGAEKRGDGAEQADAATDRDDLSHAGFGSHALAAAASKSGLAC